MGNDKPLILIAAAESDSDFLKNCLQDSFDLVITYTPKQTIDRYNEFKNTIKVAIIDLTLSPDIELPLALKQISALPEILVISDSANINDAVHSLKSGAFTYLIKPFTKEEVVAGITRCINESDALQRIAGYSKNQFITTFHLKEKMALVLRRLEDKRQKKEYINLSQLVFDIDLPDENLKKRLEELLMKSPPNILIVEDEPDWLYAYKLMLSKKYNFWLAENGKAALDIIQTQHRIDIALLDIYLPDIKGDQLVAEIKKLHPQCEIIIVTAYKEIPVANKVFQDGALDYLNKPFEDETLLNKIFEALLQKYLKELFLNYKEAQYGVTLDKAVLK